MTMWNIEFIHRLPLRLGHEIWDGEQFLGWVTSIRFDECTENMIIKVSDDPQAWPSTQG